MQQALMRSCHLATPSSSSGTSISLLCGDTVMPACGLRDLSIFRSSTERNRSGAQDWTDCIYCLVY